MQSFHTVLDHHKESLTKKTELLALIKGDDNIGRSMALELEPARLQTLSNPNSPESMQALAAHLPVLEALFHRLSLDALNCRFPAAKVALMRAALQAQNAYARTMALLSVLKQQQSDNTALALECDVSK